MLVQRVTRWKSRATHNRVTPNPNAGAGDRPCESRSCSRRTRADNNRSCTLCRKRKTRCNRGNPCSNCLRSRGGQCVYEQLSPPRPRGRAAQSEDRTSSVPVEPPPDVNKNTSSVIPSRPSMSTVGTATDPPTPASHVSTIEVESLRSRVKQLEEQLTAARISRSSIISSAPSPNVDIRTTTSHIAGTFHQQQEAPLSDHAPIISRSIMHKTRLFGQSHCMNGFAQVGLPHTRARMRRSNFPSFWTSSR